MTAEGNAPRAAWPMGRVLAALYASGASLCLVWLVLAPRPQAAVEEVIVALAASAYVVAGLAWSRPLAVSLRLAPAAVYLGSLLVSAAVLASGVPWTPYALIYIWNVLFSFHYLGRRAAVAQLVFAAWSYGVALGAMGLWRGASAGVSVGQWATTVGTLVVAAVLAGWLRGARDAEWQLRLAGDERFRLLVEQVRDYAIFMLDPTGRVVTWNAGAERAKGYEAGQIVGRSYEVFFTAGDRAAGEPTALLERAALDGRVVGEALRVRRDGSTFVAHVTITALRDGEGRLQGYAKVTRDVTELRRARELLEHRALHEPLTGLPNRALLLDRIGHALRRPAPPEGSRPAVLFVDLDRFKPVNDTLGHAAGDAVLVEVARRLVAAVRPGDTVSRVGGDEFCILCEALDSRGEAPAIAERIREAVERRLDLHGQAVHVGASVGIAYADTTTAEPAELVRNADAAMYAAKGQGGGVAIYSDQLTTAAAARLQLEVGLRRALENDDELFVVYQPMFSAASGDLTGVEALLRWRTPDGELISPATFIPVAEETGLMVPIGRRVIGQACATAAGWAAERPRAAPQISINLSAVQFADPRLVTDIAETIHGNGLEPGRIQFEITETVLMRDADGSLETVRELDRLGVRLAIDDFGTGYSSLAYLRRFAVDTLKIDRAFVQGLGRRADDTAVVEAVISVARALGLQTVGEGVERPEQLGRLRALGCDVVQGFHLARPMPAEQIVGLLDPNHLEPPQAA